MGRQINLTVSSSGATVSINTLDILEVVANGTGSDVSYVKEVKAGAGVRKITVDESPSAIVTASDSDLNSFTSVQYPTQINAWITYDTGVGTFTVGEIVLINNKIQAQISADTGTVLKVVGVTLGGVISNNDTIVGQTSGASALVNASGGIVPSAANVPAANQYTYASGITTRYLNVDRIRMVNAVGVGDLNNVTYDNSATGETIYLTDTITVINAAVNASNADVTLAANQTFTGVNTFTQPIVYSAETGITAHAGGGQGSATALTEEFNEVTTCATAGDSVKLPAAVLGKSIIVFNDGAAYCDVFPVTSGTINDGSANAAVKVAPGMMVTFKATSSTNWETNNQVAYDYAPVAAQNNITAGTGGAIIVTNYLTTINTDAGGDAFTLANATVLGQTKKILLVVDGGGDAVITPTSLSGGTTITMDDAADYVILKWNGTAWVCIENSGCTIA